MTRGTCAPSAAAMARVLDERQRRGHQREHERRDRRKQPDRADDHRQQHERAEDASHPVSGRRSVASGRDVVSARALIHRPATAG